MNAQFPDPAPAVVMIPEIFRSDDAIQSSLHGDPTCAIPQAVQPLLERITARGCQVMLKSHQIIAFKRGLVN
jgi:hypothetical protein